MPEQPHWTVEELDRQARHHLESLRAAGVEWLPHAPVPRVVTLPVVSTTNAAPLPLPPAEATPPTSPPPPSADPREQRQRELHALAERVAGCMRCAALASTRTQTVFGVGPLDPELCFIGEAPGFQEDRTGEPFVGDAGQLLTRIIVACGLKREEVYICNILRCRPPGNRTPLPDEAANCREYLEKQLELVRPRFLCALGATAAQNLLGSTQSISKLRGRFHDYRGIPVLCTFHPSYLLRAPDRKKDVWEDMKKLLAHMGRPIPGTEKKG